MQLNIVMAVRKLRMHNAGMYIHWVYPVYANTELVSERIVAINWKLIDVRHREEGQSVGRIMSLIRHRV